MEVIDLALRPLDREIFNRARECCQRLLDAGSDVNAQGHLGYTPLHFSASTNLVSVTDNGVDP